MDQFDETMARRVWGRVQGKGDPIYPKGEIEEIVTLPALILLTVRISDSLFALSRGGKGKYRQRLQQMARQYQKRKMALQGLWKLQQGKPTPLPRAQHQKGSLRQLCRSCIGDMQKLADGCKKQPAGDFAQLFSSHCHQTQQDLEFLLQVLADL